MPLEGGQTRIGPEREDSAPVGGKRGGGTGQEGGQERIETEREESAPQGGKRSGDTGLDAGQKRIEVERDSDNGPDASWPSGRLDEIEEVG